MRLICTWIRAGNAIVTQPTDSPLQSYAHLMRIDEIAAIRPEWLLDNPHYIARVAVKLRGDIEEYCYAFLATEIGSKEVARHIACTNAEDLARACGLILDDMNIWKLQLPAGVEGTD